MTERIQQDTPGTAGTGAGGNTSNPSPRSRQWCLTVNNYTDADVTQLARLADRSKFWIIAKEVGEDGTPHLQCYFQFKNGMRFSTLKAACPRGHWEIAKGTRDQNYKYCSKDGDFKSNFKPKLTQEDLTDMVLAEYESVTWKPWQSDVLEIISEKPDSRTITWIYEHNGNVGKSFLARYLACRSDTVISSGKASDIFNQVKTLIDNGSQPKVVVCDIPRVAKDYVSYQALENLKNGYLYSGKYEGGKCVFPHLHVVCFANQMPEIQKMSKDRWLIYTIKEEKLFEKLF